MIRRIRALTADVSIATEVRLKYLSMSVLFTMQPAVFCTNLSWWQEKNIFKYDSRMNIFSSCLLSEPPDMDTFGNPLLELSPPSAASHWNVIPNTGCSVYLWTLGSSRLQAMKALPGLLTDGSGLYEALHHANKDLVGVKYCNYMSYAYSLQAYM